MQKEAGEYYVYYAASQMRNTNFGQCTFFQANLVLVPGETLPQPSRFLFANTTLRNGPSKEWT